MRLRRSIALAMIAGAIATGGQDALGAGQTGAIGRRPGSPGQNVRAVPARTDTLNYVPVEPAALKSYGSFAAACDSLERLLKRVLATYADSAAFRRERVPFLYRDHVRLFHEPSGRPMWEMVPRDTEETVPSLVMTLETTSESAPEYTWIVPSLEDAGWGQESHYQADGPGGTDLALVCREAICVIVQREDFVGPDDATSVASDWRSISVTCVPRPPSHPYRRRAAR